MIPRRALAAIATTAAATTLLYNQNKPPKQPPPTEYIATSAIEAEMPKLHQKPTLPPLMKPCSFQRLETPSKQLAIDSISLALALFFTQPARSFQHIVTANPNQSLQQSIQDIFKGPTNNKLKNAYSGALIRATNPSVISQAATILTLPKLTSDLTNNDTEPSPLKSIATACLFGMLETLTSIKADSQNFKVVLNIPSNGTFDGAGIHAVRNSVPIVSVLLNPTFQKLLPSHFSDTQKKIISNSISSALTAILTGPLQYIWGQYQLDPSFKNLSLQEKTTHLLKQFKNPSTLRCILARGAYSGIIVNALLAIRQSIEITDTPSNNLPPTPSQTKRSHDTPQPPPPPMSTNP